MIRIIKFIFAFYILNTTLFSAETLIGEWYARDDGLRIFGRLNFRSTGNFDGYVESDGKRVMTFSGTWQLKDMTIYYHYIKCDPVMPFKNGEDRDELVSLRDSFFTFRTANGDLHRYDRYFFGAPTPGNQPKAGGNPKGSGQP